MNVTRVVNVIRDNFNLCICLDFASSRHNSSVKFVYDWAEDRCNLFKNSRKQTFVNMRGNCESSMLVTAFCVRFLRGVTNCDVRKSSGRFFCLKSIPYGSFSFLVAFSAEQPLAFSRDHVALVFLFSSNFRQTRSNYS